jgi:2-iminobutanoate/2-iminopropanoate deaminase
MMNKPAFHMITKAPTPVAPFSHAVETDGWVFVTGQMPTMPDNPDAPIPVGIEAQTHQVMHNLKIVLNGIGLGLEHVMRTGAYLTDFKRDYAVFNRVYASYFASGRLPARTCIGVTALAVDALVEIDFIAKRP